MFVLPNFLSRLNLRLFSLQGVERCYNLVGRNPAASDELRTGPPHGPDEGSRPRVLVQEQSHHLPGLDELGGLPQVVVIQQPRFDAFENGEVEGPIVVEVGDRYSVNVPSASRLTARISKTLMMPRSTRSTSAARPSPFILSAGNSSAR